jgi:hypothetical protein
MIRRLLSGAVVQAARAFAWVLHLEPSDLYDEEAERG